jgi:hypothetical protein
MFVVGGASLTKSNYERILDSAESMLVKSKQIVQMKKENETEQTLLSITGYKRLLN